MFVSFRLRHLSSFCTSHLARSLVFPLPTHASRGTRPRASLQATPPTLPAPRKNKKQKDISHQHSSRQLCPPLRPSPPPLFSSLQCNKRRDFTLVSHSPPAFTSLRLPVACLSEGDLISHIRTSIFLKRAKENCFDPFLHEREPGNLRNPLP